VDAITTKPDGKLGDIPDFFLRRSEFVFLSRFFGSFGGTARKSKCIVGLTVPGTKSKMPHYRWVE
jgi:hypothetical protein